MIKSWNHKGLKALFFTGTKAGIRPDHIPRLRRQLARLDEAESPHDMNVPGWRCHALDGRFDGHHAVSVNGNWRLTFAFEGRHAILVDYHDYH
ncbi:type II toxin-antitoxin system RelE/ParE family toxin [Paraburkholderia unamae]|uniref:Proteic killer suppression protein n=1 Tax=Paraburkholderia unamae TaxID=219649 RepID=A0ABX5KWJ7_9BURK|nr:type II toxin-antitoxin system RelE/ParE family toxin [Paraburkholderia unamae]PVX97974.1 proteic killer suppression protein [Paraburkholderia unamae]RAR61780.1 proteic killer suppression protein [Paraburkholderia unamae]